MFFTRKLTASYKIFAIFALDEGIYSAELTKVRQNENRLSLTQTTTVQQRENNTNQEAEAQLMQHAQT